MLTGIDCHEMRDFYRRHLSEVLDTRGGVSLSSAQASGAAVSPLATFEPTRAAEN